MIVKRNLFDKIIYTLLCVFSFGAVWFMRIIISEGIREALRNQNKLEKERNQPNDE